MLIFSGALRTVLATYRRSILVVVVVLLQVSLSLAQVSAPTVATDLTSAQFSPNCGAANVTQIFPDGFLASGQAGVNNLSVVSDPDVVLIGNQWWLIFASNPGPVRGIEPVAAYLPPGVSLSHTGIYPADPNGWHLVGANATNTGKGVAIDGTPSPAGWDTIAAETPSIDVGPDGTVSVYYAGHNLGQTNFEIGLMNNVVNGVAASADPVPAMVATQPWESANGLGAILEQSVRWNPELNKFIMLYTSKAWWDNPPDNDVAYAESTDGITWTNRQKLNFPVSYYNQDFVFNPQWNRFEMVVSNDPTGVGGGNGRDLVWVDAASASSQYSGWQNQVTLLDHTTPGTPTWRDQGLLSPAVKYGNLPGEENRIYVFFHAYGSQDPMSIARFYCDAVTTTPGYTMTAQAPFLNLAPGASSSMPVTVNPTNGFTGAVSYAVSGAPAGVSATLSQPSSTTGTTLSVAVGTNTPQGRYPITVTGTSGTLTREATFTLNVAGQSQTITIQPLSPNNITYTPGLTYTINAAASSGLPVSLSVGGNGTLNGNVLTVTGGGDIIIAANQAGNGTYSPAPQATTTLVVAPEVQTVNVAPIPAQPVGGTLDLSKYVSATSGLIVDSYNNQSPNVCSNSGSAITFNHVGQCFFIVIQFGNQYYAPAGAAAYVTVNQGTPVITTSPTASAITYGQTLASSTLSGGSTSTAGSFAFSSPATAPLAGTSTQSVIFTPSDTADYTTANGSVNVTVNQATPTITTQPTASSITYGQPLSTSLLTGGVASTPGTFSWSSGSLVPTAGTQTETVTFKPSDSSDYSPVTLNLTLTVNKATPTITTPPTAGSITYGQPLSASTLSGGVASTAGTFSWSSGALVPTAGSQSESVTFTPTDSTDFNPVTLNLTVTVNKVMPTISTPPSANAISYGQPLSAASLIGGVGSTSGSFWWTSGTLIPTAGSQTESVTFTPTDSADYSPVMLNIPLTVNKATPTITRQPTAGAVTYGQPLSTSSLTGGVASTPGTFSWTNGTLSLSIGSQVESVIFTPSDSNDYTPVTLSVAVIMNAEAQSITFPAIPAQVVGGTLTLAASASSTLAVSYTSSTQTVCTVSANTASLLAAGTCTLTASQAGNSQYAAATSVSQSFPVALPTLSVPTFSPAAGTYSKAQTVTIGETIAGTTIYYTTNGTTPTAASTVYTGPITVGINETVEAIAVGNGYNASPAAVASYSITNPSAGTPVSLTNSANVYAIFNDGTAPTNGGVDLNGYAYSANYLANPITWAGSTFNIGTANVPDALSNETVALPSGHYATLQLLGAAMNAAQANQSFIVTYSDGTTSTFTQSLNDWSSAKYVAYPGESIAASELYRVTPNGTVQSGPWNIYGYSFTLNGTKTVSSITLPANRNVIVFAIDLIPATSVPQTISFPAVPAQRVGTTAALAATASSGLPVTYSSTTSNVCAISGTSATLTGSGTCSITASQSGNNTFAAAPSVSQSFTVAPPLQSQSITFGTIPAQTVGSKISVNATASSGLPVTYSVVQSGNCSVSGNVITMLVAGNCAILANQSGNSTYSAAAQVTQIVAIGSAAFKLSPASPTLTLARANGTSMTISVTPVGNFSGTLNYSVSGAPVGASFAFVGSSTTGTTFVIYLQQSTAPGTYNLTITGTSGSTNASTIIALTVS